MRVPFRMFSRRVPLSQFVEKTSLRTSPRASMQGIRLRDMANGPLFSREATATHRLGWAVAGLCLIAVDIAFEPNAEE
jgi:hypothetical protein